MHDICDSVETVKEAQRLTREMDEVLGPVHTYPDIFFNPQLFLSGYEISQRIHTCRNRPSRCIRIH